VLDLYPIRQALHAALAYEQSAKPSNTASVHYRDGVDDRYGVTPQMAFLFQEKSADCAHGISAISYQINSNSNEL
jgi:hypothetical protein